MAENDVQLDLKKRARRRLVGAIALALAAAIILPMVMDSEQRPGNQDLTIRIPSQEEGAPLLSRPLGAAPAPERPRLPQAAAEPAPVPPAPIEADPALPLPPAVVEAPVAASAPTPVPVPVAAASSSRASASSSASSASARAVASTEAERARQILEGPRSSLASSVSSATAAPARHFVQLGLYREEVNARNAVAKAREAGIKAQVERHGEQFRVVVGPFAVRTAADEMLAKVRKAGLNGFVASK